MRRNGGENRDIYHLEMKRRMHGLYRGGLTQRNNGKTRLQ